MNVSTENAIRIGAEPVTRAGWSCPGCGTNYSPDVSSCSCTALPFPQSWFIPKPLPAPSLFGELRCTCPSVWGGICPPPACAAHGQTEMMRVTC